MQHKIQHNYQDLILLFDQTFSQSFNTRLVKGDDEPLYLPANKVVEYHQVIFARGYYASAFHEVAHWCHAGDKRRLLEDYGYWYEPDGRNQSQQLKFEQVEIIPQAIEWAFNVAAQKKFHVSADNLNGFQTDTDKFKVKVYQQVLLFLKHGFPERAQIFIDVLIRFYNMPFPLTSEQFKLELVNYQEEIEEKNAVI